MSTKLTDFTVAATGTKYLVLYLKGTYKLEIFSDFEYTSPSGTTGVAITIFNGYGARVDEIPYPFVQAVPFLESTDPAVDVPEILFDTEGVAYTLPLIASDKQSYTINVDMSKTGDYLLLKYDNADSADAVGSVWVKTS
jgi:hypothetical protein